MDIVTICGSDRKTNYESPDWSDAIKPLGEGDYDPREFLRALKRHNFKGPIILHTFGLKNRPADHYRKSYDLYHKMRAEVESDKKGVGYWFRDGIRHGLEKSGAAWCYNWASSPGEPPVAGVEFVPMIWSKSRVNAAELEQAKKSGRTLLGFNEPDAKNQANLSVEDALALWPDLQATGMRLGSPAPTKEGAEPGQWLDAFVKGANERGYRLDFICVHHYSALYDDPKAASAELKDYLTRIHRHYGKPLWLTEFALSNWKSPASSEQQTAFIREVVPMLESLPFLERYAWFALPRFTGDKGALIHTHLIDDSHQPNPTGIAYRDAR
jgi:hypothetical protein